MKMIIIDANEKKDMTFEEVLVKFRPLIKNIIYAFRFLPMEAEDMYQVASLAIWRAYESYDAKTKIGFWVLAKRAIENDFKVKYNYFNRKKRSGMELVSMDKSIVDERDVEKSITDSLASDDNTETSVLMKSILKEFMSKITVNQKQVLDLYASGKTTKEIYTMLGIGKAAVLMRINAAKKKFNSCL